jgi:hypothetical protein
MNLSVSKRLMYEIAGRPGYDLSSFRDILLMITFKEGEEIEFRRRIEDYGPVGVETFPDGGRSRGCTGSCGCTGSFIR